MPDHESERRALATYDRARTALAECARVDEAANIRSKAEKLEAYARMRDDPDLERWVAEIKLRASIRLGELSLELGTGRKVGRGKGRIRLPNDGKLKVEVLAQAGISTSRANRYEQLAGGHQVQARQAAADAAARYFAGMRDGQTTPSEKGLTAAVRKAVHEAQRTAPKIINVTVRRIQREPKVINVQLMRQPAQKPTTVLVQSEYDRGVEAAASLLDEAAKEQHDPASAVLVRELAELVRELVHH
jgi:hypothetical protein